MNAPASIALSATACLCLLMPGEAPAAPCEAADVGGKDAADWSNKVIDALIGQDACFADKSAFANSDCNIFAGRVLERAYQVTDFVLPKPVGGQRYMASNEIAEQLWTGQSDKWEDLGAMTDQQALNAAQERAAQGRPVIAVWHNADSKQPGHIALIGPGPMTPSGKLKLKTPVSASFFQGKPDRNYVGKPLACAFRPEQAAATHLYSRR